MLPRVLININVSRRVLTNWVIIIVFCMFLHQRLSVHMHIYFFSNRNGYKVIIINDNMGKWPLVAVVVCPLADILDVHVCEREDCVMVVTHP